LKVLAKDIKVSSYFIRLTLLVIMIWWILNIKNLKFLVYEVNDSLIHNGCSS